MSAPAWWEGGRPEGESLPDGSGSLEGYVPDGSVWRLEGEEPILVADVHDRASLALVLAAPDLLEALLALSGGWPTESEMRDYAATNDGQAGASHGAIRRARAALAKAGVL